jgi:hypothetical protein
VITFPIVNVQVGLSFRSVLAAKLYFWRRRSLPRYLIAALLLALTLPTTEPGALPQADPSFAIRFLGASAGLVFLSLVFTAITAWFQARSYGGVRISLTFDEGGIEAENADGIKDQFPWTALGKGRETPRSILIPETGILRRMLGIDLAGQRSAVHLPKSEPLVRILKLQNKL